MYYLNGIDKKNCNIKESKCPNNETQKCMQQQQQRIRKVNGILAFIRSIKADKF